MTELLAVFTFPLTITGASIALPDIGKDLHAGLAATQLVVNGYNACFASFLVVTGSLADVLGRRRIFAAGVALYCAGGVTSMLIDDVVVLNLVRALAGIGAATGGSILTVTFSGTARARAFGLLGTVLGVGLAFGPTLGGLLVDTLGWRAVFGVPAAITAVVPLLTPLLPGTRETTGLWLLMLTAPTVLLPTVGAALAKRLPRVTLVAGSVAVTGAGNRHPSMS
ncbi:MFS transporter [Amycolatopsis sp. H20-H5]|uniref:MFS transporter n=1 Tax=Amycolatopsis sp. H20-H5 TaxID=3046309 RepID=UPI002DB93EE6|nr:MFS transporter [Amycolatopsis sp. H20-H5]MEC3980128.1 MFS transporter [Amycolatopsis sp. H20-H5]